MTRAGSPGVRKGSSAATASWRYLRAMKRSEVDLPKDIGAPATRALVAAGYTRLAQLANVPLAELKQLHGVGPRALTRLQEALEQQDMSLG
jgi:NAD-dependent DNA ligase